MGRRPKNSTTIKHAFIYTLFAIFFILIAFGMEALLRDLFFKSFWMSILAVVFGIIGIISTFLVMKGRVKWT